MLFVILTLLVAALVASPYIVVVVKRKRMLKRIRSAAISMGFRVRKLHKFVGFSFNRSRHYDLLFENKTDVFAVKLWSNVRRGASLIITSDGRVIESREISEPFTPDEKPQHEMKGRRKSVPVTKVDFKLKKGKNLTKVMLCYPPYREMILDFGKNKKGVVEQGDRIFDKIVCFPAHFESLLAGESFATAVEPAASTAQRL